MEDSLSDRKKIVTKNEEKDYKEEENECTQCLCNNKCLNKKTKRLKNEIELVNDGEEINIKKENQLNIKFGMDLIKDSYCDDTGIDNMFIVFKAINDILYII